MKKFRHHLVIKYTDTNEMTHYLLISNTTQKSHPDSYRFLSGSSNPDYSLPESAVKAADELLGSGLLDAIGTIKRMKQQANLTPTLKDVAQQLTLRAIMNNEAQTNLQGKPAKTCAVHLYYTLDLGKLADIHVRAFKEGIKLADGQPSYEDHELVDMSPEDLKPHLRRMPNGVKQALAADKINNGQVPMVTVKGLNNVTVKTLENRAQIDAQLADYINESQSKPPLPPKKRRKPKADDGFSLSAGKKSPKQLRADAELPESIREYHAKHFEKDVRNTWKYSDRIAQLTVDPKDPRALQSVKYTGPDILSDAAKYLPQAVSNHKDFLARSITTLLGSRLCDANVDYEDLIDSLEIEGTNAGDICNLHACATAVADLCEAKPPSLGAEAQKLVAKNPQQNDLVQEWKNKLLTDPKYSVFIRDYKAEIASRAPGRQMNPA